GCACNEPGFHGKAPSRHGAGRSGVVAFIYATTFAEIIALIFAFLLSKTQQCEISARRTSARFLLSPGIATFDARPRRWVAPPLRSAMHCVRWKRGSTSGW